MFTCISLIAQGNYNNVRVLRLPPKYEKPLRELMSLGTGWDGARFMEVISMRSPVVMEIHFIRFDVQKKLTRFQPVIA